MKSNKTHLPDFLFVGTAKAGTTSVFNYLKQHPRISIPIKETFFYIRDLYKGDLLAYPKQRKKDNLILDELRFNEVYSGQTKNQIIGEVGTGYLYHYQIAIPEIKRLYSKEPKIIIVLRNPIERTHSAYLHFKKYSINLDNIQEEIAKENKRKQENFDFMWQFSAMSFYAESVKAYLDNFKEVEILFYEDLKNDPVRFLKNIIEFLNLQEHQFDLSKTFNPSGNPKNSSLQKAITGDHMLKRVLRPFYHKLFGKENVHKFRDKIRDSNLKKTDLTIEDQNYLFDLFEDDILALQELLGSEVKLKEKWNLV